MIDCLDKIIEEAKCCAGKYGHKLSGVLSFGNSNEELLFDFMRLNIYIRTLERNKIKHITTEQVTYVMPEKVNINSLHPNKKNLYLNQKPERKVVCVKTEIPPCLADSEIRTVIEQIKLLCSSCNCDCN